MLKRFIFAREDQPDKEWLGRFVAGRDEAERWYLGEDRARPPTPHECRAALSDHLPELLAQYDRRLRPGRRRRSRPPDTKPLPGQRRSSPVAAK